MVVPAFNEEGRIGQTLSGIRSYLEKAQMRFEIIVVDDGSGDSTWSIVDEAARGDTRIRLVRNPRNMGKGYSVRRGVKASVHDMVLFSDADLSTPIEELEKLVPWLESFDLVIASRSLPDSQVLVHQPAYRELMGRAFNAFVQVLLVRGMIDTQCGFKLMNRKAADGIFRHQRINSFAFDVEMILIAKRLGLTVKEVPVRWIDSRASKVHPVKHSAQMLLDLFRLKLYDILGFYRRTIERE